MLRIENRRSGGDAANQAILLTKLGLSAACCALLGQDEEADLIRSQLKAQGVDIRWLSQRPGSDNDTFVHSAG